MAHVVKLYVVDTAGDGGSCGDCVLDISPNRCKSFRQLSGELVKHPTAQCPIPDQEFRIAELDQPTDNVYAIGVLESSDG